MTKERMQRHIGKRAALLSCLFLLLTLTGTFTRAFAEDRQPSPASSSDAVSGNPAFTEYSVGSGALGRRLQIPEDWGIRLGGVTLSDVNNVFSGGARPGSTASNNVLILGVEVDGEKKLGWKGGSFGVNFLQLNAQDTNGYAGTVPGYNSIVAAPPFVRTELYEYWITQEVIPEFLKIRVGQINPAADFNNVTRPAKLQDEKQNISSVSSLIYTSIFVNPTFLGVIGGYYDSAFGTTVNIALDKNSWINAGVYDGNKARGVHTGLEGPRFNGYVFSIAEAGTSWVLGPERHPGQFGIGGWYQSGKLEAAGLYGNLQQTGTAGLYLYGSQRVWAKESNAKRVKSVSIFYQYGVNNSKTLNARQFVGVGATAFAIFDNRPDDSFGVGMGLTFLNRDRFQRASQLMFQTYYQAALVPDLLYLQPTLTFIPTPGAPVDDPFHQWSPGMAPNLPAALVGTLRLTAIF